MNAKSNVSDSPLSINFSKYHPNIPNIIHIEINCFSGCPIIKYKMVSQNSTYWTLFVCAADIVYLCSVAVHFFTPTCALLRKPLERCNRFTVFLFLIFTINFFMNNIMFFSLYFDIATFFYSCECVFGDCIEFLWRQWGHLLNSVIHLRDESSERESAEGGMYLRIINKRNKSKRSFIPSFVTVLKKSIFDTTKKRS